MKVVAITGERKAEVLETKKPALGKSDYDESERVCFMYLGAAHVFGSY